MRSTQEELGYQKNNQATRGKNMYKFTLGLLALAMVASTEVMAASSDEIQVYDEAINKEGEFNVDIHMNYVPSGPQMPAYDGEIPSYHNFRMTPEFGYGLSNNLEAGLYVPFIRDADGLWYSELAKLRLKYIGDNRELGFYWGINGELGASTIRTAEQRWNLEFRPILGYKSADWNLTVNPILGFALSGNSHIPGFSPSVKISRKATEKTWLNIEHYADFGNTNRMLSLSQETYLTADSEIFGHDFHFGVGHDWLGEPQNWIIKSIFNIPLN